MAHLSTIPTIGIRAQTAALAMIATFVVGLVIGVAVSGVALPRIGGQSGTAWSATEATQAWLDYRAAERVDLAATGSIPAQSERAWLDYRAGERADLSATGSTAAERAWLDYRAGERADLTATGWTAAEAEGAWLDYRAGERADF